MKSTQKYVLSGIRQLIDLNKEITNFDLNFTVTSTDGSDFEAIVVDQNILDSNPNPEYKNAPGTISGNIISDKGIYQNYFLLLKCDPSKTVECEVSIDLKEIPLNPEYTATQSAISPQKNQENFKNKTKKSIFKLSSKFDFKTILIILLILASITFIYFKFFKTKSTPSNSQETPINDTNLSTSLTSPKSHSPIITNQLNENDLNIITNSEQAINNVTDVFKKSLPQITIPKISSTPLTVSTPVKTNLTPILPDVSIKPISTPSSVKSEISHKPINSDLFKRLKNIEISK